MNKKFLVPLFVVTLVFGIVGTTLATPYPCGSWWDKFGFDSEGSSWSRTCDVGPSAPTSAPETTYSALDSPASGPGVLSSDSGGTESTRTAPVPEPATMLLLGSGLVGLAVFGRKKFSNS